MVNDLVGGQGRSGNFAAYELPFSGSTEYIQGDVMGRDEVVQVETCDHVDALVRTLARCVASCKFDGAAPDSAWPARSLAVHKVMSAVFESALNGGSSIQLEA